MTGMWCSLCMMVFTLYVTHLEPCCGIRGDVVGDLRWLKAYHSVRSHSGKKRARSSSSSSLLVTVSVRAVGLRNVMLYFSSLLQEWQNTKGNDTDYVRFIRVINTPSFMPLKNAFHQLLSSVSKWLMAGLFLLLVHSSSCLCSVSHPRCRSTFTIQMTLTASVRPSRKDASFPPWPSSLR